MEVDFKNLYVDGPFESGLSLKICVFCCTAGDIYDYLQRKSPLLQRQQSQMSTHSHRHWRDITPHTENRQSTVSFSSGCWSPLTSGSHPLVKARPWSKCPLPHHAVSKGPDFLPARSRCSGGVDQVPYGPQA